MAARSERITFANAAGEELAARLDLPDGPPGAFALFAHCFTCSMDSFAASRISRGLAARGDAVLRFDFTGPGPARASSPTPISPPTSRTWRRQLTGCVRNIRRRSS